MATGSQSFGGRALARLIPGLTRKAFADRGFHQAAVLTDWPEIVGEELAGQCVALELSRDGILAVRAHGSVAVAIQHIEPQILDRIATYFGFRAVKRLAIRQGLVPKRSPRRGAEPEAAPLPSPSLDSKLADLPDPGLRQALLRLGARVEQTGEDK